MSPTGVRSMSKDGRSVLVGMLLTGVWFACCVARLSDLMLGQRCPWSLELSQWDPRRRLSVCQYVSSAIEGQISSTELPGDCDTLLLDTSAIMFSRSTDSVSFLAISVGFPHGIVGIPGARLPSNSVVFTD